MGGGGLAKGRGDGGRWVAGGRETGTPTAAPPDRRRAGRRWRHGDGGGPWQTATRRTRRFFHQSWRRVRPARGRTQVNPCSARTGGAGARWVAARALDRGKTCVEVEGCPRGRRPLGRKKPANNLARAAGYQFAILLFPGNPGVHPGDFPGLSELKPRTEPGDFTLPRSVKCSPFLDAAVHHQRNARASAPGGSHGPPHLQVVAREAAPERLLDVHRDAPAHLAARGGRPGPAGRQARCPGQHRNRGVGLGMIGSLPDSRVPGRCAVAAGTPAGTHPSTHPPAPRRTRSKISRSPAVRLDPGVPPTSLM